MINIDLLRSEVYKQERKKLYIKTLLFNLALIIFVSITLSGVAHNQREEELMTENSIIQAQNDSLRLLVSNELKEMKERENLIIRSALNLSNDTTYNEFDPNSNNIFELAENQSKSLDLLDGITIEMWDSINSVPVGSPISSADLVRISDKFGWRKHPILKKWVFHEGTDFAAETGMDIVTTSDGVVERVIKSKKGYGNRIVINHGYGYKTVYAHLSEMHVKTGQSVKRGDLIGYVGNTGRSTGPHLHYEVLVNNRPTNPQMYFYYGDELAKK
jgi:murein DD-endopeptidase MepM/ murein hydrolase activator NlpD